LVNENKQVIALGFNGIPRGVRDDDYRYADRDLKYKFVSHAERNALDNAFVSTKGATLYSTLFPCNECAKGIIQKGIKHVVTTQPDLSRVHNNVDISLDMFNEAGVKLTYIDS
jgi:dCMP deaminase